MRLHLPLPMLWGAALWLFSGGAAVSLAQDISYQIEKALFVSPSKIDSGYALLLNGPDSSASSVKSQRRPATVVSLGENRWEVRISLSPADLGAGGSLVLFARDAGNKLYVSEVRTYGRKKEAPMTGAKSCQLEGDIFDAGMLKQFSEEEIRVFLSVKRERTKRLLVQIKEQLTPKVLEKINALEASAGTAQQQPVTDGIGREELALRLALLQALQQW